MVDTRVLTIVIIVSYYISTTPNWLEKKHCVEWNYSCIETWQSDRLCEPDLDCQNAGSSYGGKLRFIVGYQA